MMVPRSLIVATWRSMSIGWQTSYSCDLQVVIKPDPSGAYVVPNASGQVDVSKAWFSRMMGMEVDYSWDLFVYAPGYFPSPAPHGAIDSPHAPWALASYAKSPTGSTLFPITLQAVQTDPQRALAYYASYLSSLDCDQQDASELSAIRRDAHKEALELLCSLENPSAVNARLASQIVARPVGLISLAQGNSPETVDLKTVCGALKGAQP